MILYGISTCDTCKKAIKALQGAGHEVSFRDIRANPLSRAEIDEIARKVAVIHCSSCGAPVDLRRDHACAHCRSALSLLDPKAVETALAGYAKAHLATNTSKVDEVANALVMLERDHQRALREKKEGSSMAGALDAGTDLLGIGVAMVWKLLAH